MINISNFRFLISISEFTNAWWKKFSIICRRVDCMYNAFSKIYIHCNFYWKFVMISGGFVALLFFWCCMFVKWKLYHHKSLSQQFSVLYCIGCPLRLVRNFQAAQTPKHCQWLFRCQAHYLVTLQSRSTSYANSDLMSSFPLILSVSCSSFLAISFSNSDWFCTSFLVTVKKKYEATLVSCLMNYPGCVK